jgi:hypothetical protein
MDSVRRARGNAEGRGGWMLDESRWSSVREIRAEKLAGRAVERDVVDRSLSWS